MNTQDIENFQKILKNNFGLEPLEVNLYSGSQLNTIPPFINPGAKKYFMFEGEIIFNGFGVNQNISFLDLYNNSIQLNFVTTAIKTTDVMHFDKLYFKGISCSNFNTFMAGTICEIIVE
jgi:hypothetical protein